MKRRAKMKIWKIDTCKDCPFISYDDISNMISCELSGELTSEDRPPNECPLKEDVLLLVVQKYFSN